LQDAASRIAQSRAQLGVVTANLLPTVGFNTRYDREAISKNGRYAALGAGTAAHDYWTSDVDASWELDLWGRARRDREGAAATLESREYDKDALQISLSAEVANDYIQLRGAQSQLDIAHRNQKIAEQLVALTENRARNGVATEFDVSSSRAYLASVNASLPDITRNLDALMNSLALLAGEPPRALDGLFQKVMPIPSMPDRIPIGLPSGLARHRPDILSAEQQLHAATAAIGVAKANFYPSISLTGTLGLEAFESHDLNTWDSRFFSVGPAIYLPIFEGGRLTQRLRLSEEKQKAAAINYRKTVLNAWHEIDNALESSQALQVQQSALQQASDENERALLVAINQYREGAADYLAVLTSQRNLLTSQSDLNTASVQTAQGLVNLFKALGGGWNAKSEEVAISPVISGAQ
jgi:NodT family efflux transporter outer membrane factor (OMF) lipoprotein